MKANRKEERGPREIAYDENISPLMAQIIALCKEHKIPMVATFELDQKDDQDADDPLMCSTFLLDPEWGVRGKRTLAAYRAVRPEPGFALAETIVTNPDGSKHVTIRAVR